MSSLVIASRSESRFLHCSEHVSKILADNIYASKQIIGFSLSFDSVSCQESLFCTLHTRFTVFEIIANEVLTFSLSSKCSGGTAISKTSFSLGIFGGRGCNTSNDKPDATSTWPLIGVVIPSILALAFLLLLCNGIGPTFSALVYSTCHYMDHGRLQNWGTM